jgi:hypothetical protein
VRLARSITARRVAALPAVFALGVLASGCESTQAQSARIAAQGKKAMAPQAAFSVGKKSPDLSIKRAVVLSDKNGSSVAVELAVKGKPQANVPILFAVKGKDGKRQFINNLAGLQPSLQHLALASPGKSVWWVNDQLLGAHDPVKVKAKIGTGTPVTGDLKVLVTKTDFHDDPAGVYYEGTLVNKTGKDLLDVPVFGVGLRGDEVVAAGRALVPKLPAKPGPKPVRFRVFFTGDPRGTDVHVTVAPTITPTPVSEGTTP